MLHLQAEEAHPVDQESQGNTLVSVAPLNPPPETPEKPSANGESPEAAKTQEPPPTNGHSTTANTADTEMWNSGQIKPTKTTHSTTTTHTHTHKFTSPFLNPILANYGIHSNAVIRDEHRLQHQQPRCHGPRHRPPTLAASTNIRETGLRATMTSAMIDSDDDDGSVPGLLTAVRLGTGDGAVFRGGKRGNFSICGHWFPWWLQPRESRPRAVNAIQSLCVSSGLGSSTNNPPFN